MKSKTVKYGQVVEVVPGLKSIILMPSTHSVKLTVFSLIEDFHGYCFKHVHCNLVVS